MANYYKFLKAICVKIETPKKFGTGFLIDEKTIITCAHNIENKNRQPAELENIKLLKGGELLKIKKVSQYYPSPYPDLVIIEIAPLDLNIEVRLNEDLESGDNLIGHGFSSDYSFGGENFQVSFWGYGYDKAFTLLNLKSDQIKEGFSGAPLLNTRTNSICGIVKRTKGWDYGGRAIPIDKLLEILNQKLVLSNDKISNNYTPLSSKLHYLPKICFNYQHRAEETLIASYLKTNKVVLLHGLGGIGKTQLAVNYAKNEDSKYNKILWLTDKRNEDSIILKSKDFFSELGIQLGFANIDNTEWIFSKVCLWLMQNDNWLLVIDNLKQEIFIKERFYKNNNFFDVIRKGHVIITSQKKITHPWITNISLKPLEISKSVELLKKRIKKANYSGEDLKYLQLISEYLGSYPLLVQISGAIVEKADFKIKDFYHHLELDPSMSLVTSDIDEFNYYEKSFKAIMQIAFSRLASNDTFNSLSLLNYILLLSPAYIPDYLIESIIKTHNANPKNYKIGHMVRCLSILIENSIITREEGGISIHRMIQKELFLRLSEKAKTETILTIFKSLLVLLPENIRYYDFHLEQLFRNIEFTLSICRSEKIPFSEEDQRLVLSIVKYYCLFLLEKGEYKNLIIQAGLWLKTLNNGIFSFSQISILNSLALSQEALGKPNVGLSTIEQAILLLLENSVEKSHLSFLKVIHTKCVVLDSLGRYKEGIRIIKSIRKYNFLDKDSYKLEKARGLVTLGNLLNENRKFQKAHNKYKQALEIRLKIQNRYDPLVARIYNNMGKNYLDWYDFEEDTDTEYLFTALDMLNKAEEILEKTLGDLHPEIASCYSNKGIVYMTLGESLEGEKFFLKAKKIWEIDNSKSYSNLDLVYSNLWLLYKLITINNYNSREENNDRNKYLFWLEKLNNHTESYIEILEESGKNKDKIELLADVIILNTLYENFRKRDELLFLVKEKSQLIIAILDILISDLVDIKEEYGNEEVFNSYYDDAKKILSTLNLDPVFIKRFEEKIKTLNQGR